MARAYDPIRIERKTVKKSSGKQSQKKKLLMWFKGDEVGEISWLREHQISIDNGQKVAETKQKGKRAQM